MKPGFSDERIVQIIEESEAGGRTADVCRRHGISTGTFSRYKAKFGGMELSDARKLRALADGNARLKQRLAARMPDNAIPKEVVSKNGDARHEADSCRSCPGGLRGKRAAGLRCAGSGSVDGSISNAAVR